MNQKFRSVVYPLMIIGITVIACASYWVSLLNTQHLEMEAALHRGELHVEQINNAVDQQLDATLRSVDTALRHLRSVYLHNRKDFDRSVLDIIAAYPNGMLQIVTVAGADGYLGYSSNLKNGAKPEQVYIGDREHFRVHADSEADQLFISKPIIGRIAGVRVIQITRAIREGKRFAGVIGIPLRPDYISNNLSFLHIASGDLISIALEDGSIIARSRKLDDPLKTPADRPYLRSHPGDHGIYRDRSLIDHAPMLYSWRHLSAWPVVCISAIDEDTELKGVYSHQSESRKHTLLSMALVIIFVFFISALVMRINRKNHALALSEKELRIAASAFESDEGILVTDANNVILRVNRTFSAITGFSAAEAISKNPSILSSGRHGADFFTAMWHSLAEAGTWEGEIWNRRKSGEIYPEHLIITAVKDANGSVTNYVASFSDISKRIQAEVALKESHQQISSLLNSMAEGAYGIDINGNCTFVNRSFLKLLGYQKAEEIIGKAMHELIHHSHPDGRFYPAAECLISKAYRKNQDIHVSDEVFWTRDGIAIPVEYWSQPIVVDGVAQGAIATFIDVTERKKLEAQLKESELRYRTVADYTSDWEYWIMPDNSFRYVSPSSAQICGYTPEEFYANLELLPNIIYPEDLPAYTNHVHGISDLGVYEAIDFRILTKKGEIRWISHLCRPVHDAEGNNIGQRCSNRDISERRAADEQIRNLAFFDTLTQLPNRRLLNDRLKQTLAASKRNARYAALMFLDLDNFKPLNDTCGHGVGDLLLVEVARRISRCVREMDTVARFGGDEFVVILTELDADKTESSAQAGIVAEKIRALLAEPYLLKVAQDDKTESIVEHHCTSSIGVVLFSNQIACAEDILKWADMAMYQAKENGRNSIRFFNAQPESHASKTGAKVLRLNWHASYACGEATIDHEHREIFDLANALIDAAFTRNENPQEFEAALHRLLAHIKRHFCDEERILARNNYTELEGHVRAHKVLLGRAQRLQEEAATGGVSIGELVNFLANDVVLQHMLKLDRKFYPLFNPPG
jgi:diguanylate cyclase (GGDEF)-like protein/hemerythrin-like metal-binding protein/PAS domain S-box-containing protein